MHWEGDLVIANNHSPAIGTLVERQIRSPALVAGLPAGRVSDQLGGSVVAIVGMVIAIAGTTAAVALPGKWWLLASAGCIASVRCWS